MELLTEIPEGGSTRYAVVFVHRRWCTFRNHGSLNGRYIRRHVNIMRACLDGHAAHCEPSCNFHSHRALTLWEYLSLPPSSSHPTGTYHAHNAPRSLLDSTRLHNAAAAVDPSPHCPGFTQPLLFFFIFTYQNVTVLCFFLFFFSLFQLITLRRLIFTKRACVLDPREAIHALSRRIYLHASVKTPRGKLLKMPS